MKRSTSSRIAGVSFLAYIALVMPATILFGRATKADGIAAKLAMIAQHSTEIRIAALFNLLGGFAAVFLAVSLYAITRDEDADLAMIGLAFRLAEGVIGGMSIQASAGLLWLATTTGSGAIDPALAPAFGAFLLRQNWSALIAAMFFAVGSTVFCWLMLRGRIIPVMLARLGVAASILVLIGLPLQLLGIIGRPVTDAMWLPLAAFEIPLGIWLIVKGAAIPQGRSSM